MAATVRYALPDFEVTQWLEDYCRSWYPAVEITLMRANSRNLTTPKLFENARPEKRRRPQYEMVVITSAPGYSGAVNLRHPQRNPRRG